MKDSLDSLVIYKVYVDMMYYFYMLTDKYPKHEKFSLVPDIKRTLGEGLSYIIYAQKSFDVKERLSFLNRLDASLKILKVFVRISYRRKYISSKNYGASCRKIIKVNNLMFGWLKSCQRH